MRLGIIILNNFCDYNMFEWGKPFEINEGSQSTVYFQLVDLDQKISADIKATTYLRYIPPAGSIISATIQSIDQSKTLTKTPTALAEDRSIWSFGILPTDKFGSANLFITLTEPGPVIKKGVAIQGIVVHPSDPGSISFC